MNFVVALRYSEGKLRVFCYIPISAPVLFVSLVLSLKPTEMLWKYKLIKLWGRFVILIPVLSRRKFEATRLAKELGFVYYREIH